MGGRGIAFRSTVGTGPGGGDSLIPGTPGSIPCSKTSWISTLMLYASSFTNSSLNWAS